MAADFKLLAWFTWETGDLRKGLFPFNLLVETLEQTLCTYFGRKTFHGCSILITLHQLYCGLFFLLLEVYQESELRVSQHIAKVIPVRLWNIVVLHNVSCIVISDLYSGYS